MMHCILVKYKVHVNISFPFNGIYIYMRFSDSLIHKTVKVQILYKDDAGYYLYSVILALAMPNEIHKLIK